jgi:hypothetical protein
MAVTYTILKVEPPSERIPPPGVATIEVDFGDKSPVYRKRMMADVTDEAALKAAIEGWLTQYLTDRTAAEVPSAVTSLLGKPQAVK